MHSDPAMAGPGFHRRSFIPLSLRFPGKLPDPPTRWGFETAAAHYHKSESEYIPTNTNTSDINHSTLYMGFKINLPDSRLISKRKETS
jgi:hypothetical protein